MFYGFDTSRKIVEINDGRVKFKIWRYVFEYRSKYAKLFTPTAIRKNNKVFKKKCIISYVFDFSLLICMVYLLYE